MVFKGSQYKCLSVRMRAAVEKELQDGAVPFSCGNHQRRLPIVVPMIRTCACLEQIANERLIIVFHCIEKSPIFASRRVFAFSNVF